MRTWFGSFGTSRRSARPSRYRPVLEGLEQRTLLDAGFVQTSLVSSIPGLAPHTDKDLINPWGISQTAEGRFRISSNGNGAAPLITAQGRVLGQPVELPPPLGSPPDTQTSPTGNVANTTSDFVIRDDGRSAPASVIFSTEDGTIVGWNATVDRRDGVLVADRSAFGAVYKGLAMGSNAQGNFLYASDFHNGHIDVFDTNFHMVTLGSGSFGTFTDPKAPAGYAPFGVKNINGTLFVTYAKQRPPENHDDDEGPGHGFIDEFDTSGNFLKRLATGTDAGGNLAELNSPFGMAVAPDNYGPNGAFSHALLVGNFGDSHVSAFDMNTGALLGQLSDAKGQPLTLNGGVGGNDTKGLWAIAFGNGHGGAATDALFFTSGINDEADGLFGKVTMTQGNTGHRGGHDSDEADTENTGDMAAHTRGDGHAHPDTQSQGTDGSRAGADRNPSASASQHSGALKVAAPASAARLAASARTVTDLVFKDLNLNALP